MVTRKMIEDSAGDDPRQYSRRLAIMIGAAVAFLIIVGLCAIAGSYAISLHLLDVYRLSQHSTHCSDLRDFLKSSKGALHRAYEQAFQKNGCR